MLSNSKGDIRMAIETKIVSVTLVFVMLYVLGCAGRTFPRDVGNSIWPQAIPVVGKNLANNSVPCLEAELPTPVQYILNRWKGKACAR